jgi:hypothetical protein
MAREILIWLVGVPLTVLTAVYALILGEMIAARRRINRG